jgi:hypothetical protein
VFIPDYHHVENLSKHHSSDFHIQHCPSFKKTIVQDKKRPENKPTERQIFFFFPYAQIYSWCSKLFTVGFGKTLPHTTLHIGQLTKTFGKTFRVGGLRVFKGHRQQL